MTSKREKERRPLPCPCQLQSALQYTPAKAYTLILKWRLQQMLDTLVLGCPQRACAKYRNAADAISRVAEHCREVRALVSAQRMTIHDRKSGAIRMECAGGIQLCVDCTRAFDSMPRRVMYDMLVWAGVDADLIALILEWHNTGTYRHGSHAEAQHTIRCNQGVTQGCVLAPSLWTIYMACVMFQIDLRCSSGSSGLTWSQEHATAYADDLHFRWMMLAVRDLRQMRKKLGLTINREKSVLVISVKGIQAQTWLHKLLCGCSLRRCIFSDFDSGMACTAATA